MTRALVAIGPLWARCEVARTSREQAKGLDGHPPLADGQGMLFPFSPPRATAFHMAGVAFPIDIVFADARGRVARVVHAAEPGTRATWSQPVCSAVVELRGGACRDAGIDVGHAIRVHALARAEERFSPARTIDDPIEPHDEVPPDERFRGHRLPDEAFSEANDQPNPHFEESYGYQPSERWDDIVGPNVRRSQIVEPGQFIGAIVEAMAREQLTGRAPIPWKADVLNAGATESAVVTRNDVARWLSFLSMDSSARAAALETAVSNEGLTLLADGLVLAELADTARVQNDAIVLFRGRR